MGVLNFIAGGIFWMVVGFFALGLYLGYSGATFVAYASIYDNDRNLSAKLYPDIKSNIFMKAYSKLKNFENENK